MPLNGIGPLLTVDETVVLPLNYKGYIINKRTVERRIELRYHNEIRLAI